MLVKHAVEDEGVFFNVLRQIDLLPRKSILLQFSHYEFSSLALSDVHIVIAKLLLVQWPFSDDHIDFRHC